MSSSAPAISTENDEPVDDMEAPRPGEAAADLTVSSPHDVPDEDEDMEDDHDEYLSPHLDLVNDSPDADDWGEYMYDDDDEDGFASDVNMDDEVGDVDDDLDGEGGKLSAEVEATLEALWRKVVAAEEKPSAAEHTCSVCMEHLTCEGAHRICCIPCGHVYGRSCLERWLRQNGNLTARCPRCAVIFAGNQIINLYAPGNLWEGCGRVQEAKVYVREAIEEMVVQCERKMKATRAQARSKIAKLKAEHRSYYEEVQAEARKLEDLIIQTGNERRAERAELQSLNAMIADMNRLLDGRCAQLMLIKQQIASAKGSPPPAKPAELLEEGAPV